MATWAQFADDYLFEVQGCTAFQAERALRHAAREFCQRTLCHRMELDPVLTVAGVASYEYDPGSTLEVVKLISATLDGQDLPLLALDASPHSFGIMGMNPVEFSLQPVPAAGLAVLVTALVKPSGTASSIEDRLYASHALSIAAGAKAILFGQAGQPYSDLEQSIKNRAHFENDVATVKESAARGFSRAPLRVAASFM